MDLHLFDRMSSHPSPFALSATQRAQLSGLGSDVSRGESYIARVDGFCRRVHEALGVGVAVASCRRGRFVVLSAWPGDVALALATSDQDSLDRATSRLGLGVSVWKSSGQTWTLVGLCEAPGPVVVLLLQGDWSASAHDLVQLAERWVGRRSRSILSSGTPGVTGLLAELARGHAGLGDVCRLVLRHVVAAVPSRLGAIAIASDEGNLSITATHGYPITLVEALRIMPGSGVIGQTYERGTPTRVVDARKIEGRSRPRYRTASYVALPIIAAREVLGVVCLTDKEHDRVYTAQDVASIEALLAPAALALGRERAEHRARLFAQAAIVDPASRLFNRPHLEKRLEEELERASRQGTAVSLLMIDIDEFKSINDTFGHVAGDVVIRGVAEVLSKSIRVFDVCSRYGGEEFAIVMPGSNLSSASTTADRIRNRIEAYKPDDQAFSHIRVTASIGVAQAPHGSNARHVIELADRALYAAKRAGKNQVRTSLESERR